MKRTAVEDGLIQGKLHETLHLLRFFEVIPWVILQLNCLFGNLL